jgi:serine/threonine-protein kinase RsbW
MNDIFSQDTVQHIPENHTPEHPVLTAIFPAQYDSLDKLRDFVAREAEAFGFGAKAVYQVQLAVDEAFTNIIEHAYGGECQEDIGCTCQIGDECLTITLQDCGQAFDPKEVADPDLVSNIENRKAGGLGLYLIKQLMDEVYFTLIPKPGQAGKCNVLTMVKQKKKPA